MIGCQPRQVALVQFPVGLLRFRAAFPELNRLLRPIRPARRSPRCSNSVRLQGEFDGAFYIGVPIGGNEVIEVDRAEQAARHASREDGPGQCQKRHAQSGARRWR